MPRRATPVWSGRYVDGLTAVGRAVRVRLDRSHLYVLPPAAAKDAAAAAGEPTERNDAGLEDADRAAPPIAAWPLRDVRLIDEPRPGAPVRLRFHGADARLTVDDPGFITAYRHQAPQENVLRRLRQVAIIAGITLAAAGIAALAIWLAPGTARTLAHLLPSEYEVRLGERVVAQIPLAFGVDADFCRGAEGRAALDRLIGRIAGGAALPYPLTVRVVDAKVNNAVATLGEQVVLFGGLIDFAETPEEVAGVLAHEIAHVIHRHPVQALIASLGLSVIVELVVGGGTGGGVISGAAEALTTAAYSREMEREADASGLALLAAAGIEQRGLSDFLARAAAEDGEAHLGYLSTHPSAAERVATSHAAATEKSGTGKMSGGPAMSDTDWQALSSICAPAAG